MSLVIEFSLVLFTYVYGQLYLQHSGDEQTKKIILIIYDCHPYIFYNMIFNVILSFY